MTEDSNEEKQKNELEVIQSMYGEAVIDKNKTAAWNVWHPIDILLTLKPLYDSKIKEAHCSVTLRITCSHNYPDKAPNISIHEVVGLSTQNSFALLDKLNEKAESLHKEVMIHELAVEAQNFLSDFNKPKLSFYEEMIKKEEEDEKMKRHNEQMKENDERQKIKDEIKKRQEAVKDAEKQKTQGQLARHLDSSGDGSEEDALKLMYYAGADMSKKSKENTDENISCTCEPLNAFQSIIIAEKNNKKIHMGKCLGHSAKGSTTFLAIDTENGATLVAKKWSMPVPSEVNKWTTLLNREIKAMSTIKHPNLVPYFEITKNLIKHTNKLEISVFRNFVLGTSLRTLSNTLNSFGDKRALLKMLRHVALGVFSALAELHRLEVSHRNVRINNIFLAENGDVKLVGGSVDGIMKKMINGDDNEYDDQTMTRDIFEAGRVLLSIIANESQEIPPHLQPSAKDFFARCLPVDEEKRWTAQQLIKHSFLAESNIKQPEDDGEDCLSNDVPLNDSTIPTGHSRIQVEFEILQFIGTGAFGCVMKVKNKLDGGFYAIKKIKLNPKNVNLNNKIQLEVKLISCLNHENVVRYYSAWTEVEILTNNNDENDDDEDESDDTDEAEESSDRKMNDSLENDTKNSKRLVDVKTLWSTQRICGNDNEDDGGEAVQDDNKIDEYPSDPSIVFDGSNEDDNYDDNDEKRTETPQKIYKHYLYIQMEYCEKNTLRHAINNGLYNDIVRAWRLFREIVEGLAHVHQQGMIHRDLKPENIFLNSNDRVKIGDFGLATNIHAPVEGRNGKVETVAGSLTSQIGTALYVAPEIAEQDTRAVYNQKVDIYSLGIIMFEMFYGQFNTVMERINVIKELRKKEIVIPEDFGHQYNKEDNDKITYVIRWLLNHDAKFRPTCVELLSSEHVPRAVPQGTLSRLLTHTLNDRNTPIYKKVIELCLDQTHSTGEDYLYHYVSNPRTETMSKINYIVVKVFKSHGAFELAPALLTPRTKYWVENDVKVMTAPGLVCQLPHDLRIPFARHIAYTRQKYTRRYIVDRVFREQTNGRHPREIMECAFDIVTPEKGSLWSDTELLVVAYRAASECSIPVTVQLNHFKLLNALLLSCGITEDKHVSTYHILKNFRYGNINSLPFWTHLASLCISKQDEIKFKKLMELEVPIKDLRNQVTQLIKDSKYYDDAIQAVHELEIVSRNAVELGCECTMTVVPFLALNLLQHCGIYWQMSVIRDSNKPEKHPRNVIAAGGRYDALFQEYRIMAQRSMDLDSSEMELSALGFSMSLYRMALVFADDDLKKFKANNFFGPPLICVCVSDPVGGGREGLAPSRRAQIARDLWARGCTCCLWNEPANGAKNSAHEYIGAAQLIVEDDSKDFSLFLWNKDNTCRDYRVHYSEVVETAIQLTGAAPYTETQRANRGTSLSEVERHNTPIISVAFVTAERTEKLSKNVRKSVEAQINTQITSLLNLLGIQTALSRVRVNTIAVNCNADCIRSVVANLNIPLDETELRAAFKPLINEFRKLETLLKDTRDQLILFANLYKNQNRSPEDIQLYALYSIQDSLCRLIT